MSKYLCDHKNKVNAINILLLFFPSKKDRCNFDENPSTFALYTAPKMLILQFLKDGGLDKYLEVTQILSSSFCNNDTIHIA